LIVSFGDYVPAARYDGLPWTEARIEEGLTETGPWVLIDTIALSPVDTDPSNPIPRSFTTENATIQNGWYKITFADASGDTSPTDPIFNAPPSEWRPTVRQVATHLLARTVNQYGVRQGTFTTDTTPTAAECDQIISLTMPEVADIIGDEIPEYLWDDAAAVTSIRAAMQVEIAFYPEQINSDRSPYKPLKDKFEYTVENLRQQIANAETGDTGATVGGTSNKPSWSFPTDGEWLTRTW
jgi:hypothetical protein